MADASTGSGPVEDATGPLRVDDVSKTFAGQRALDHVSVEFAPGEVHCLLGQNGSGKSTLVKILSGFHTPDPGGTVAVGGRRLVFGDPDSSRQLGLRFAHQQRGVIDAMSAVENASLGRAFGGSRLGFLRHREQEDRTRDLLARVGVADLDVRRPLRFARAVDRAAVAIARAVDPTLGSISYLILDEPTAALPPVEVDRLFELIAGVKARGTGIVYVSHRLDEIFRIGDRVSVLRDARHVGTYPVTSLDRGSLIELIVGERISEGAGDGQVRLADVLAGSRATAPAAPGGGGADAPDAAADPGGGPAQAPAADPLPAAGAAPGADGPQAPRLAVEGLASATLRGVSFSLGDGEVLGIAGLAGSGRESLVYALVGAQRARSRSVSMAGTRVGRSLSPRSARLLGIVLAPGNRMPGSAVSRFSLRENVTLPTLGRYRRGPFVSKRAERDSTVRWLRDLAVSGATGPGGADKLFPELSGGNQQKVILAKALNTVPSVVLLDEPTAGVDVGAREVCYDIVRRFAAGGVSFVVSSSDVDDLLAVCDRVLVLRGGAVTEELRGEAITEAALLDAVMQAGPEVSGAVGGAGPSTQERRGTP